MNEVSYVSNIIKHAITTDQFDIDNKIIKKINFNEAMFYVIKYRGPIDLINKFILLGGNDFNTAAKICITFSNKDINNEYYDKLMNYFIELLQNGNKIIDYRSLCLESVKQKRIDLINRFIKHVDIDNIIEFCFENEYNDILYLIFAKYKN